MINEIVPRVSLEEIQVQIGLMVLLPLLFSIAEIQYTPSITSLTYIFIFLYHFLFKHSFRKLLKTKPIVLLAILIIYHHVNGYLYNPVFRNIEFLHGARYFCAVCIFSFLLASDCRNTLKALIASLVIWILLAIVVVGYTPGKRMSGEKVIAVQFGKYAVIMAICSAMYCSLRRQPLQKVALMCIFPVAVILMSQTRTAFGMLVIILFGYYYAVTLKGNMSLKTFVALIILGLIGIVTIEYILENTNLGNRFTDTSATDSYEKLGYTTGTIFDTILGERLIYWVFGWKLFIGNPVFGIGLDAYKLLTGGNYPMHVEYMMHLCEGGIIGAALWLLFIGSLFQVIFRYIESPIERKFHIFLMGSFLFGCLFSVPFKQEVATLPLCIVLAKGLISTKIRFIKSIKAKRHNELTSISIGLPTNI